MNSLPFELVDEIARYLDGKSLFSLSKTCQRFFNFQKQFLFTIPQHIYLQDDLYVFKQPGNDHHAVRVDWVEKPSVEFPLGRRVGTRTQGDICITSRLCFGIQSMKWEKQYQDQGLYFEVEIVDAFVNTSMRIGLITNGWDEKRPPGSMPGSVGYCNEDGNISVGTKYDDRFVFGPKWGMGDVVGCGYTKFQHKSIVFFTLNGQWIGDAPLKIDCDVIDYSQMWFCAFSSNTHCKVKINSGQHSFAYDLDKNHRLLFLSSRIDVPRKAKPEFLSNRFVTVENHDRMALLHFCTLFDNSQSIQCTMPLIYCQEERNNPILYYEVKILSKSNHRSSFMSIGLAMKPYSQIHHIGWSQGSIGFHSDDGNVFYNSYGSTIKISNGYDVGSIIRVGFDPLNKTVSFAKNGLLLYNSKIDIEGPLYISIAATREWTISVHYGKNKSCTNNKLLK